MTRLPTPGGDEGNWGQILNDYLRVVHKSDGTLKDNSVGGAQLQTNSVGPAQLQPNAVTNATLADDSVTESSLAPEVVAKLNATSVSSVAALTGDITSPGLVAALAPDLRLHYAPVAGTNLTASGIDSWAQGRDTQATGFMAHAEGDGSIASEYGAHAEGFMTTASGAYAHAEGLVTKAFGDAAHAEGYGTVAVADTTHAEGYNTTAFRLYESVRGSGGNVRHSFIPALSGTASQASPTFVSATGVITIPVHAGLTSGKVTVMTTNGTIRWDIAFSASNNATTYASRATGTVTIPASAGTVVYGSSATTWVVTGNTTGQVIITPSSTPPVIRVWCELLQLGSVTQTKPA